MKVLVATPYYAPVIGGLENYARNVNVGLRDLGHDVVVVTSGTARTAVTDVVDGLRVRRLPAGVRLSNTPVHPLWPIQMRAVIREERPDVVLAHTPVPSMADVAARALGDLPFVVTYHNDLAKDGLLERAAVQAHWSLAGAGTLERADRIITTSQLYRDRSARLAPLASRVVVVPPGVDTGRFHRDVDGDAVRGRFAEEKVVLFVSSLARSHAHKGLGLLLRSVRELRSQGRDLRLVVVGRGDGLEDYRAEAGRLGVADHVTFAGFVPDEELPAYYAAADVFVLPSTNRAEGFGMVLLEAAACGTPVVGTDVGGIPAALQAVGSPYLAQPDLTSLTDVLGRALAEPRDAESGPDPVSWADVARRTEDVLVAAGRTRVALVHNVVAPYRLPLFDELSDDVDVQVFFTQGAGRGRRWDARLDGHRFHPRQLPSVLLGPVAYNPGGWRRLRRSRFDVLITNTDPDTAPLSLSGLALARLRRKPVLVWSEVVNDEVWSFPGLATADTGPKAAAAAVLRQAVGAYRGVFLRRADGFLAFSGAARDHLLRHGVAPAAVTQTVQVVPDSLLPPGQAAPRSGTTFVYVGYLTERKNVRLLIDAFGALTGDDVRLVIAGTGPQEAWLRERAAGDPRITFRGYVDGQAKADLYCAADVLVLPTQLDCWGLVVNEAMHYGLAVIVSDAAASRELVTPDRGVVVPSGDAARLAAAMQDLVDDPVRLQAMRDLNRGHGRVCDVRSAGRAFVTAIRAVAPGATPAPAAREVGR